ncbi:MAG TPA: hypothetical protein VNN80_28590 [Polyangiaceae bacterium]|nr:hypothetical protein [Polyangiaceae bacterium]
MTQTFKEMIAHDIAEETVWIFDRKEDLLRCVEEIEASSATPEKKLEGLEELWIEYEHLRDYDAPRRADFLVGPTYGIPITDDPTEIALLGGAIETHLGVLLAGSKWWLGSWWRRNSERLRFTISGGIEARYGGKYAFDHQGWFFGVGLSGEFSDNFVNLVTGASGAASKF